jgi:hypothetical protein
MKVKIATFSIITVLTIATAIVALIIAVQPVNEARNSELKPIHRMEANYPVYGNLKEMVASSTLVIRGTVTEISPSYRVIPESVSLEKLPPEKAANVGYLMTDVIVKVDQVLYSLSKLAETSIVVSHLGGEDVRGKYVMEGEPLSQQDLSYIFFLEQSNDGRYVIVGGSQGRYTIQNGNLLALAGHGEPVIRQLDGMNLTAFEKGFTNLLRASESKPQVHEEEVPSSNQESLLNKPKGPPVNSTKQK